VYNSPYPVTIPTIDIQDPVRNEMGTYTKYSNETFTTCSKLSVHKDRIVLFGQGAVPLVISILGKFKMRNL
jgi:hypothetical protein